MYIAVILENFDVATRENAEPLTADDFEQFFEVWQKFDDKLTQLISYDQLQLLLHQLDMPLKVPFPNRPFITHYEMQMTSDGQIHCLEVIIALIKKVLGDSPALNAMKAAMVQTFQMKCKSTVQYEPVMTTMEYARMDRAAKTIQNAWREWYYEQGGRELRGPVTTRNQIAQNFESLLRLSSDTKPCIRSAISLPNMQVLRREEHKLKINPLKKRSLDSLIKGLKSIRDEEDDFQYRESNHHNAQQNRSILSLDSTTSSTVFFNE